MYVTVGLFLFCNKFSISDNYEVNIGEQVHIPCTASGVPKPDIVWTKMNSQTNETSSLNVQG